MKLTLPQNANQVEKLLNLFKTNFSTKQNAVFRKDLLKKYNLGYSDRLLRQYIQYIRQNDLCGKGFILSNVKNGYWYTEDEGEMKHFITQELGRMATQFESLEKLQLRLRASKVKISTTKQMSIFN